MPDFDNAIAKTIAAHKAVVAAAKDVGADIEAQRQAELADAPIVLPVAPPLPPSQG